MTVLIRSPRIKSARGSHFSDGIIFSEFLTGLFTVEAEKLTNAAENPTYQALEEKLAKSLASYLIGKTHLHHPSTNSSIRLRGPITVYQVAILAQNKAYELTASELEQRVFTRGGAAGDSRDVLDNMTAVERIEFLAGNQSWLYFEVRNTVKHRPHKTALGMVARWWLGRLEGKEDEESVESVGLMKKTLENIEYLDWERGERRDLWEVINRMIRPGVESEI